MMSVAVYFKGRNRWRLTLPVEGGGKKYEWFNTDQEAAAARLKFFHEDPYGIHLRRLGWGTKAEQAAYRAELERAETGATNDTESAFDEETKQRLSRLVELLH